jgi:hypothetical protein
MDLSLILVLKQKMKTATQLSEVWNYFLDHFGLNPDFVKLGRQTPGDPFLTAVLDAVGQQLYRKESVSITNMLWKELPDFQFLHGVCEMERKMANVLYFEDLKMGVVAIPWSLSPPETKLVRFRGALLGPPSRPEPSVN